jgi:hypothetical protein
MHSAFLLKLVMSVFGYIQILYSLYFFSLAEEACGYISLVRDKNLNKSWRVRC